MAEHVDCTGMTLEERKKERDQLLKEKHAYNAEVGVGGKEAR